jgi:hypothetical protein
MSPLVIIRFANPRHSKNAPALDEDAMRDDLHAQLEVILKDRLGEDTELRLERGETNEIRVEGRFPMKPLEVKSIVSEALGEVMEAFDPSGYAL